MIYYNDLHFVLFLNIDNYIKIYNDYIMKII